MREWHNETLHQTDASKQPVSRAISYRDPAASPPY
ncbi:hypothetical protein BH11GEM1_BH11GEM1_29560 [soil metagenome]